MMNELYDLCDNLMDEIRDLTKKGDISPTELDRAFKAVDIIKDIKTIEAMEDSGYSYDEYSRKSYAAEGTSHRGRDAMGRYTSREDEHSGHEEKEHMMRQIEQMKRKIEQM